MVLYEAVRPKQKVWLNAGLSSLLRKDSSRSDGQSNATASKRTLTSFFYSIESKSNEHEEEDNQKSRFPKLANFARFYTLPVTKYWINFVSRATF